MLDVYLIMMSAEESEFFENENNRFGLPASAIQTLKQEF